jgi:hypothetical protein
MLRLDERSETKLLQLITQFGVSKDGIIRHLMTQTTPEDVRPCWQVRERSSVYHVLHKPPNAI